MGTAVAVHRRAGADVRHPLATLAIDQRAGGDTYGRNATVAALGASRPYAEARRDLEAALADLSGAGEDNGIVFVVVEKAAPVAGSAARTVGKAAGTVASTLKDKLADAQRRRWGAVFDAVAAATLVIADDGELTRTGSAARLPDGRRRPALRLLAHGAGSRG